MEIWQAIVSGIIQGVTEFFPVSSSSHLNFFRSLLSIKCDTEFFDLSMHFGTWVSLVIYLRRDCIAILKSFNQSFALGLALLPLIPTYIFFSRPSINPGYSLIFTGILLLLAPLIQITCRAKLLNMLWIGVMQCLSFIPGISRSGSTMAAGKMLGMSWFEAARSSFLLSIPTIFGGEILLLILKLTKEKSFPPISPLVLGFITSFIVGCFTVRIAFNLYKKQIIRPFAWYCFAFGLLNLLRG